MKYGRFKNWPTEPFTGEYRVKAEQCKKMVKSLKQLNKEHQASDKNRFFLTKRVKTSTIKDNICG